MPITSKELGRRIREAREACGLTQGDVGRTLGVSRPTVTQMESGRRAISSLELDRLAHLYGRDIKQLLAERFRAENPLSALFRAQPEVVLQRKITEKLRDCLRLGREVSNLERLLGLGREANAAPSYPIGASRSRWGAIQQGTRVAAEERRRLDLGLAPASALPDLLELQGIRTALVDLPDDISGLTLNDQGIGFFIVINRRHHPRRRRFSFAHEYAHLLIDRDRIGFVSRVSEHEDLVEVRANSFAAAFLMPKEGVERFVVALGKGQPSRGSAQVFDENAALAAESRSAPRSQEVQLHDVVQLAAYYGVSVQSALYRLRNLRLISEEELLHLKRADEEGGSRRISELLALRESEPDAPGDAFRHRFMGLALEAHRRRIISRGKLDELIRLVGGSIPDHDEFLESADAGEASSVHPDAGK